MRPQALIRRLKVGEIHLLGHTAGNRIARVVATQHPEIVQTVILCAPGGHAEPEGPAGTADGHQPERDGGADPHHEEGDFLRAAQRAAAVVSRLVPVGGQQELARGLGVDFSKVEAGGRAPILIVRASRTSSRRRRSVTACERSTYAGSRITMSPGPATR
jgi:pimeloyl-ACP methyl ester carboxylesterase